jgi:hypothetical protein
MTQSTVKLLFIGCLIFLCRYSNAQQEAGSVKSLIKESKVNYDSLRIELEAMYNADQEIRRILIDSIGLDSPESAKYLNQMATIDMHNRPKIASILEKYGWIEESKIGKKAAEGIFYVVQHSDLPFVEKYFPQFKRLADRGEANPTLCAMMEDRLLMWKGKKQIYGTQANNNLRQNKKFAIWPIENPSRVNELRKKIGFTTTVEENAIRLNAEYDANEKLPSDVKSGN